MAVYAFDGTWNFRDLKDAILTAQPSQYGADASFRRDTGETNVHRFREFIGRERCEYLQGVGTRFSLLGRLIGGAFGAGAKWRVRKMYRSLCERYQVKGDRDIDIIGFSRGAATAVHFANVIHAHGIRDPRGPRYFAWHYDTLLGLSWRLPKPNARTDGPPPTIRFLGLWDTVASIGVPIGPFRNRVTKRWRVTTVAANVVRSFHAMALDEVRATFALIRPVRDDGEDDRHYELWFRGVHSNVGGGYFDRGLSDISLAWMMEMYLWTLDTESEEVTVPRAFTDALQRLQPRGLPTDDRSQKDDEASRDGNLETLEPNADGELGRPRDIRRQAWRAIPPNALVHHAAFRRTRNLLLDHQHANRRLLRPIPGDARPVYDPPYFYGRTPRQEAEVVALEAFYQVPVRAGAWLTLNRIPVVRSDDWLGAGARRKDVTDAKRVDVFVQIATEWLLRGCCPPTELGLPKTVLSYDGREVDAVETAQWVIEVLTALDPYVPSLREYRSRANHAPTGGQDGGTPR